MLRFLGMCDTVERAVELLGLPGGDGETVSTAVLQAVSYVLEKHGYVIVQLSGYRSNRKRRPSNCGNQV